MKTFFVVVVLCVVIASFLSANERNDFRFALGLYQDRNYRLAESQLRSFIDDYPQSRLINSARFILANVCLEMKDYREAKELFEFLKIHYDDSSVKPEIIIGLIQAEFHLGNYSRTKTYINRFFESYSNVASSNKWKVYHIAGRIDFAAGKYEEAYEFFARAEELQTFDHDTSHYWIVKNLKHRAMHKMGNSNDVKSELLDYVRQNVKNEYLYQALYDYCITLFNRSQYEELLEFAPDYISVKSPVYDDYLLLVIISHYELGNYTQAAERLDMVEIESDSSNYYRALVNMKKGITDVAKVIFQDLIESAEQKEIRINSKFYYAGLVSVTDIELANRLLKDFIGSDKDHLFRDAAHYQIGYNYFQTADYIKAVGYLFRAVNRDKNFKFDDPTTLETNLEQHVIENLIFLLSESYFFLNRDDFFVHFNNLYLSRYPSGRYRDEAMFKKGLYQYGRAKYAEALITFSQLIRNFPDSEKKGLAHFYQGSIFLKRNQAQNAKTEFELALPLVSEKPMVWLKIAQLHLIELDYEKAEAALLNVPDSNKYLYEKSITQGNIRFAQRNFTQALIFFENAQRYAPTAKAEREALIRQARTHYQLKNYQRATDIYSSLSERDDENRQYLMLAATSAFSAENYNGAIDLFDLYLQRFPEAEDADRARLHIGDSYYNLQNYIRAVEYYIPLIISSTEEKVRVNALNGLEWSSLQSEDISFISELEKILEVEDDINFKIFIYERKAYYYFNRRQWLDAANIASFLLQLYDQRYENPQTENKYYEYSRVLAVSYTNLEQTEQADRIFRRLYRLNPEPAMLYDWAVLKIAQQDTTGAIEKLREASRTSQSSQIWLELLNLQKRTNDRNFSQDYNAYLRFSTGANKERAQLIWVRWNIRNHNFESVENVLKTLLESNFEIVKANAQYLKGLMLYEKGEYEASVPELLRIRYLYPNLEELKIKAETLACYAYLNLDDKESARRIFEGIRTGLDPSVREHLDLLISEGGRE